MKAQLSSAEICELEAKLRIWNRAYYDLHEPIVSDKEYDKVFDLVKELRPDSPALLERSQFDADYKHEFPMGSLEKCKTPEDIVKRLGGKSKNNKGTITAKLDGASLTVHYEGGHLVRAVTRGRTETGKGKIVTANAMMIPSIPKYIGDVCQDKIEVRGEVVILNGDFVTMTDLFSNPRNAASGGISCQDPNDTAKRKLTFIAVKVISHDRHGMSDMQDLDVLNRMGFMTPKSMEVDLSSVESVKKAINEWLKTRATIPCWNDGIVIRIKDDGTYMDMGFTGVCPKGACAFKFENESAETVIKDIVWTTGRMGFVTPVAFFEPVQLGGATIEKCTLNNPTWMKENGNPAIGSKVTIAKMNDIIPNVVGVLTPGSKDTKQPTKCPSCGASLIFAETNDGEGAKLKCTGDNCPAKKQGTILNSLKKFEIKGIADKNLEKMTEAGLLNEPWEIFDLTVPKLVSAGWGKRESEIIVEVIKGVEAKPTHILAAIGLEMWGRRMFEKLVANSKNFTEDRLLAGDFPYDELSVVPEIGPARAKVLSEAFKDGSYARKYLSELLKRVKPVKSADKPAGASGGKLAGMTFCLSGSMEKGKKQIGDDIAAAGGVVKDGVSKDLSFLVAGEGSGSKSEKAAKYGVKILTEAELYSMIG